MNSESLLSGLEKKIKWESWPWIKEVIALPFGTYSTLVYKLFMKESELVRIHTFPNFGISHIFFVWEGHDFAFMESHGYLATCPTNLGTGMRASVHVNLPGFKTKQEVKDYVKTTGKFIRIVFQFFFKFCECFFEIWPLI